MKKTRLFFFIFFFCHGAYSEQFFYHYDSIDAENAFRTGFSPAGLNRNMYDHIRGISCIEGNDASNFISTSALELVAHVLAESTTPVGGVYYLYTIRPTSNFFNSAFSLAAASIRTNDPRFRSTLFDYMYNQEWLALGGIDAEQILSARAYRSRGPNQQAEFFAEYLNPAYRDADTLPNSNYYYMPDLPRNESSNHSACTICSPDSISRMYKRDVTSDISRWRKCKYKMLVAAMDN